LKKQGLDIRLGAKVTGAQVQGDVVKVRYEMGGAAQELEVDALVVAVGRRPVTQGVFAPEVGLKLDKRGFIEVDEECRSSVANVWAVGDVVRGPMLAHKGMEEGVMVAELIAGQHGEVNYKTIPSVIYTAPEIAWVGQTEEEVKKTGRPYKVGTVPFSANGRAKGMQQTAGLVKLIADKEHDDVLGVHIVGPVAGELVAEAVLAMEFQASAEDIQRTIHAHPTLSESLHEASLNADKRSIHGINR
jgi:dihydrolipoamide dehydrogenase